MNLIKRISSFIFIPFLIIFLLFVFSVFISYKYTGGIKKSEYLNVLFAACVNAREISRTMLEEEGRQNADSLYKNIFKEQRLRYSLFDKNGELIADSRSAMDSGEKVPLGGAFYQALRAASEYGEESRFFGYSQTDSSVSLALPVFVENEFKGIISVEGNPSAIHTGYSEKVYIFTLVLVFFGGITAVFIAIRSVVSANDSLYDAAKRAYKSLSEPILSEKEKSVLGENHAFFLKLLSLDKRRDNDSDGYRKWIKLTADCSLSSFFLIDDTGKIILSNAPLGSFLKDVSDKSQGRHYREIIGGEEFFLLLKKAQDCDEVVSGEFEVMNRFCSVCAEKISAEGKKMFLVSVFDLSPIKEAENRQNRFIVNTAHELKTPLSVIIGFLEMYEGESQENKKKFMGIIKKNLNRLNNLVKDLLLLTQTDDPGFIYDFKKTDMKAVVLETLTVFEQRAKEKGINLHDEVEEKDCYIFGDEFLLMQMAINLVDNSIKYNKEGGESIVSLSKVAGMITFSVRDTGIGISVKDREKIFSRFYTADKSRSRELGGTGLGLSIVKSIAERHSAYVSFESEEGKGSVFTVSFPELKS